MVLLDCESRASAYRSVSSILAIEPAVLDQVFASFDLGRYYEANRYSPRAPEDVLFDEVAAHAKSAPRFDGICWFHLTRTRPDNTFSDGVLPLGSMLESLWDLLRPLALDFVTADVWHAFRVDVGGSHSASLYRMKARDPLHWGPYAMLVRELAFRAREAGNHDYLAVPEIVQDIALCFSERFGHDLLGAFQHATSPCIVKFVSREARPDALTVAIRYLYDAFHGHELTFQSNTCFDGGGKPIPPGDVLSVQMLTPQGQPR